MRFAPTPQRSPSCRAATARYGGSMLLLDGVGERREIGVARLLAHDHVAVRDRRELDPFARELRRLHHGGGVPFPRADAGAVRDAGRGEYRRGRSGRRGRRFRLAEHLCRIEARLAAGAARSASLSGGGRAPLALGDLGLERALERRLLDVPAAADSLVVEVSDLSGELVASWSIAAFMSRAVSRARSVRPLRWTVASATCESAIDGFRSTASSISTSVNSCTRRSSFWSFRST